MEMWEQKGRTEKGVKGVGVGAGFISSKIKVKQRCPCVLKLLSASNSSGLMRGITEVGSSPGWLHFFMGGGRLTLASFNSSHATPQITQYQWNSFVKKGKDKVMGYA